MIINVKSNKGFTTADVGIAMIIAVIFATIMTSLFYNVFMSSTEGKRTATALNYAVDIFEDIGKKSFDSVTPTYSLFDVNSLVGLQNGTIAGSGEVGTVTATLGTYEIMVKIENYKDTDKIKIITLKINYPVSRKENSSVELQRLKVKEEI